MKSGALGEFSQRETKMAGVEPNCLPRKGAAMLRPYRGTGEA